MANPILSSDLYRDDGAIKEAIKQLKALQSEYAKAIESVRKESGKLKASIEVTTTSNSQQREVIRQTSQEADKLKKTYDKLVQSQGDSAKQLAVLQNEQRKVNQLNRLEAKLLNAKEGSYERLSAQYSINKLRLNQLSAEERKATKEGQALETQTKEIFEEMKRLQEATGKNVLSVGDYGKALGPLREGFNRVGASIKAFLANPVLLTVTAIVGAFAALKRALSRSEEGQDALNRVMRVTGSVLDNVLDIVSALALSLFTAIPAAVQKAGNFFSRFSLGAEKGFKSAQLALANFLGQTEKADRLKMEVAGIDGELKNLKKTSQELTQTLGSAFDGLIDKVSNFGDEVREDMKAADALAALEARRNRAERQFLVENAKLAKDAAALRASAEETKKVNAEASLEALQKVFDLEEKAAQNEVRLARIRAQILREQSALASDDIDAKREIAQAEAEIFRAEAAFEDKRRERLRSLNRFRLEAFKQESERQKAALEISKLAAELEIENARDILENEKSTVTERVQALQQITAIKEELANRSFEIEKAALEKERELRLKSEEDFLVELEVLRAKRRVQIEKGVREEGKVREKIRKELAKEEADGLEFLPALENLPVQVEAVSKRIEDTLKKRREGKDGNIFMRLLGLDGNKFEQFKESLKQAFEFAQQQVLEFARLRSQAADQNVQNSQNEVQAAQAALQAELQKDQQGFASKVETAEKALRLAKDNQRKALEEQRRAQRAEQQLQAIQQAGNLVTASTKIWGTLGFPFAIPAIAIMWGSFIASKVRADQLTKKRFGEGGLEVLGGGSHASGQDTYLGFQSEGKPAYGERGEAMAIVNRGSTGKYMRNGILPAVINSLNRGSFEKEFLRLGKASAGIPMVINAGVSGPDVSTGKMEGELTRIRKQGEIQEYEDSKGRRVVIRKNVKKIYA